MKVTLCDRCNERINQKDYNEHEELLVKRRYPIKSDGDTMQDWVFRIAIHFQGRKAHLCLPCLGVIMDKRYDPNEENKESKKG